MRPERELTAPPAPAGAALLQSTSDVSRSASSSETTERGRKATPLLLADLDKELQKLHSGKNQLVSGRRRRPGRRPCWTAEAVD